MASPGKVWENTLADWQWVLGVNLWGVIYGVHFFVPIMLKQNTEYHIVNTASVGGLLTAPGSGSYCVSKHGVVALSETLYRELEQSGHKIGVSVLCPGIINTKINEFARNRPPELQNAPGEEARDMSDPKVQEIMRSLKEIFENGMPPQQVADIVFKAVKENRFYIYADTERFVPMIKARLEDIAQVRNPITIPLESLDL